nr:hypothetical protein [Tanacetum cinerariifolium]GEX54199.1 hypothetical protein [Tanacetum cinerariifolium]GEX54206.1 hypothetical protein [Tanacetum cinerariifolium]
MSTQQDIYAAGSESRPPLLNKENYVPWSSHLRYAKSRPNGKLIHNSIINGPYVRRMIPEPGDINQEVPVTKTFHVQTDDELTEKELKHIEADDQAIQTILLGLSEDIYAVVDGCETAQEIWLRVQQMMKGSDIGIQEKKAKLFNEWERFTSNEGESIESYYHRFLKLMNDSKKTNTFQRRLPAILSFCTICSRNGVDMLPLFIRPRTCTQLITLNYQPSYNQNYMQQPMPNPEDITDPITAMNMALALMAKAFKLNYSTPTNNNQRISSNPRNRQIAQLECRESKWVQRCIECRESGCSESKSSECWKSEWEWGVGHFARNWSIRPRRRDAAYLQTHLLIAQKEEAGIQLQAEEFDLMAAAADLDDIEKVNANCILMANLQQASTSGTQTDKALIMTQTDQLSKVLLEKHDPPVVHDSEETLQLAQESREKMKKLNKEIKPANYTKINHLSGIFVSQSAKSREELYFSNDSKTANVLKSISIPNEEFSDDTTPSVVHKFLNEVKSTIVTLQHVVKHRMTLKTHNWSSSAHQELHKIVKDENFPIVNQVDAKVQNFEIQFLKEAAKFVGDFKSLAKEADESLGKHKTLELEIKRLLRAVVSQDIISVMQKESVVDTSDLQTELERMKECFKNYIIKKENDYAKL